MKIASPAGCGCKSNIAQTLSEMGVKIMLAGNMGEGAVKVLNNSRIEVLRGCSGYVKTGVLNWLDCSLTDDTCNTFLFFLIFYITDAIVPIEQK